MPTPGSIAETPEFAAPAETNTGSENTNASATRILTEMRSSRSAVSQPLAWNLIQHTAGTPTYVSPMDMGERSEPHKRFDHARSSGTSKPPSKRVRMKGI